MVRNTRPAGVATAARAECLDRPRGAHHTCLAHTGRHGFLIDPDRTLGCTSFELRAGEARVISPALSYRPKTRTTTRRIVTNAKKIQNPGYALPLRLRGEHPRQQNQRRLSVPVLTKKGTDANHLAGHTISVLLNRVKSDHVSLGIEHESNKAVLADRHLLSGLAHHSDLRVTIPLHSRRKRSKR